MYLPSHFEESSVEVMHDLMRTYPLATLVSMGSNGINANHVPMHLSPEPTPFGTLRGHVARANPMWSDLVKVVETLVIFQGPESYISPSWYATKREHGKVVPTWNYIAVHAYGELRVIDDPLWLRAQVEALTKEHEGKLSDPWTLEDAPNDFIERMLQSIVGIEMVVAQLSCKKKMSQNQSPQNRAGVVEGLELLNKMDVAALIKPD